MQESLAHLHPERLHLAYSKDYKIENDLNNVWKGWR
jgi:hypothetical protein